MLFRKQAFRYGITATKITSERVQKEKEDKIYECDKITDIRLINFCVDNCPHDKCTGNQCKELIDYKNSIRGICYEHTAKKTV